MKTLTVGEAAKDAKMLTQKAWAAIGENQIGEVEIFSVTLSKPNKRGTLNPHTYEPVTLLFPEYVCGRQGEAQYVHLASFPDRLCWRARTAKIS